MFVDSHCHLSFPELLGRVPALRTDMAAAQVDRALVICTTLEEFPTVHGLAMAYDNFWCSAGVHPDTEGLAEPSFDGLRQLALQPKVVAVGETGLDYFRTGEELPDFIWDCSSAMVTSTNSGNGSASAISTISPLASRNKAIAFSSA